MKTNQKEHEPLPLGWTRVTRNNKNTTNNKNTNKTDDNEWCCNDQNCRRRRVADVDLAAEVSNNDSSNNDKTTKKYTVIQGTAIWCLPDPDCDWFQGYLFSISNSNGAQQQQQYGLLCQNVEIDECLQCSEGGYRELTLQVTPFHRNNNNSNNSNKPIQFANIEWTGADMMRLRTMLPPQETTTTTAAAAATSLTQNAVQMDADCVWTGTDAESRIQSVFGSLLRQLRQDTEDDDGDDGDASVHDLMPNAAVVTGKMQLRIVDKNIMMD